MLREAVRDGLIDKNPAESVEPMGKDFRPTTALTDAELAALFPDDPDVFDKVWPGAEGSARMQVQYHLDWPRFIELFAERVSAPVPAGR